MSLEPQSAPILLAARHHGWRNSPGGRGALGRRQGSCLSPVLVGGPMQIAAVMHPTLLRTPGKRGRFPLERILPGPLARYTVVEMPKGFFTVRDALGARVYFGRGPSEVLRSPAPF